MDRYGLTDNEQVAIDEFRERHKSEKGFKYSVHIIPTGIGNKIEIKCLNCGKKEDITDYSVW